MHGRNRVLHAAFAQPLCDVVLRLAALRELHAVEHDAVQREDAAHEIVGGKYGIQIALRREVGDRTAHRDQRHQRADVGAEIEIDDVRESPALDIIHLLGKRHAKVTYSDPHVPMLQADGVVPEMSAIDSLEGAAAADCVVIVTDHKKFDYSKLVEKSKLILDTRNALKGIKSDKIARL